MAAATTRFLRTESMQDKRVRISNAISYRDTKKKYYFLISRCPGRHRRAPAAYHIESIAIRTPNLCCKDSRLSTGFKDATSHQPSHVRRLQAKSGRGFGSKTVTDEPDIGMLARDIIRLYKEGNVQALSDVILKNIRRFDQTFWMEIADESDRAETEGEKKMIASIASSVRTFNIFELSLICQLKRI